MKNKLENKIKNKKNFCAAFWSHFHFTNDGKVYPCCLTENKEENSLGNINNTSIDKVYNGQRMKKIRKDMIDNKPLPNGCHICVDREKKGLGALRIRYNDYWFDKIVEDINLDTGEIINFKIKSLDIRLSNKCNFSCAMCSPKFSTKWSNYEEITGVNTQQKLISVDIESSFNKNIKRYLSDIEFIHFAGGEPIIMPEHWKILDTIDSSVKIMYTTNASTLRYKERYVFDEWRRFDNVDITLSIDAIGDTFE